MCAISVMFAVCVVSLYVRTYVWVSTIVHMMARGATGAGRAMALPRFLPNLKNTWSTRACPTAIMNGRALLS